MQLNPYAELAILKVLSPMTVPVVAPVFLGVPPVKPETMTPYEAQDRYGYERPAVAHQALRAKQRDRVFGQGIAPSDEGIIESQAVLGSIA